MKDITFLNIMHKMKITFSRPLSFKIADLAENVRLGGPEKQSIVSSCSGSEKQAIVSCSRSEKQAISVLWQRQVKATAAVPV